MADEITDFGHKMATCRKDYGLKLAEMENVSTETCDYEKYIGSQYQIEIK